MTQRHPDREECLEILEGYDTPAHVVRHCIAVTDTALEIARALMDKGFTFNLPLIQSAGLLHDIARVRKKHWKVGADFAHSRGFIQEARIIRRHMTHSFDPDPAKLKELDMVCLGDRLILEDKYAGLDARMDYVIKKSHGNKIVMKKINRVRVVNRNLINNIESIIGISIDDLIGKTAQEG